ncbi:MAG: efflux RND transporter periplasmic adaptor subunit [Armatimonadetes bacterium]|nr:efflux RND transporter periplasmic adaptor subunit [Armatimonadota bacterium]
MKKKIVYLIGILLVLLVVIRISLSIKEKINKKNIRAFEKTVVQVTPALITDLTDSVELTGSAQPILKTTFSSKIIAKVKEIYVNEGDKVEKDALLLLMEDSDLTAQEHQSIASVSAAKARLQQSIERSPITQIQTKGSLDQAKANLRSSESSFDNAKKNLERQKKLFQEGYISQQILDNAENQYQIAKSQLLNSKSILKGAKANLSQNIIQEEDVSALSNQLKQAQANLEYIKTQIEQTKIIAPYSGYITGRFVDPGALASPGAELLSIANPDTVWVEIMLPEEYINKITLGKIVTITFDALDSKSFNGKIVQINPGGDSKNLSFKIRIAIPNSNHTIKVGMFARAKIVLKKYKNVVTVPKDAVFEDQNKKWVFVVNADKANLREVSTGFSDSVMSEIKSGIKAQEMIITLRPTTLKDGDSVKIELGEKGLKH